MIFVAHAGHWLLQMIYVVPLLVFLGILVRTTLQDRRERRVGESAPPGPPDRADSP